MGGVLAGIDVGSLKEGFSGSEDVLAQMFGLFEPQARERMVQLTAALAVWDTAGARQCLHSLVNISGAVHAYGMSEQAKALGEAVRGDNRGLAAQLLTALGRETELVLRQAAVLRAELAKNPAGVWTVQLPE